MFFQGLYLFRGMGLGILDVVLDAQEVGLAADHVVADRLGIPGEAGVLVVELGLARVPLLGPDRRDVRLLPGVEGE